MRESLRLVFILAVLTNACSPAASSPTQTPPSPFSFSTNQPSPTNTSRPASSATPNQELQKASRRSLYALDVTLDYAAHYLGVSQQIDYVNTGSTPLNELVLLVEAENMGAGFELISLIGDDISEFERQPGQIFVSLSDSLLPGESVLLELNYGLALPERASWLGWTERQTNLIDWYPFIPPRNDEGDWLIHPTAIVGEHLVYESSDFEVNIHLQNAPASAEIAAAAPAQRNAQTWSYSLHNARRFAWSVSGQYQIFQTERNGIPIRAYVFAEHQFAGQAALRNSADALTIFEQVFGPYPYESLSIVEGQFEDGMESDAFFFLDRYYFQVYDGSSRNYLTTLNAHETAHNWWFGQVGSDQALEPWLDEALATYSELIFYENAHPDQVDWWWQFRVASHSPNGPVDTTIYETAFFSTYVGAVYLRGAQFLDEIRRTMGDEAFFGFLRDYAQEGNGRIVNAQEFFRRLAEHNDGVAIRPMIDEYFRLQDQ